MPFTPAQLAAARFTGAPAVVDAGPGTGKTVIERIRYRCEERGARPNEILALRLSNEAAQELSERVAAAFGDDVADALNVRTFHGFGVEFLHLHGHHLGLGQKLEQARPGARPFVYSGRDGRIYEYLWSRSKKSLPTLSAALEERRAAFARGEFGVEVSRYQCDRCVVRAGCPAWMAAGSVAAAMGSGSSPGAT